MELMMMEHCLKITAILRAMTRAQVLLPRLQSAPLSMEQVPKYISTPAPPKKLLQDRSIFHSKSKTATLEKSTPPRVFTESMAYKY